MAKIFNIVNRRSNLKRKCGYPASRRRLAAYFSWLAKREAAAKKA